MFKLRRVSSTQRNSNDDESVCEFVSKSICYGTSATLHALGGNHEMVKPQKMELFVVSIVLAEFGPACAVSTGCMWHRSGDVPPVSFLHMHTCFHLPCSQTSVTRLACRSMRAPVAHGSADLSRKIEVGVHSVDSYNSYANYFE